MAVLARMGFRGHDLRRAFVTHLGKKGRKLGFPYHDIVDEVAKITPKGEGTISVIEKSYDLDSDSSLKLRMLELWQHMIISALGEDKRPDNRWFDLDVDAVKYTDAEWRHIQKRIQIDQDDG